MKFMNNHYGQSIIFKHARMAAPDGGEGLGDGAGVDGSGGGSGSNPDDGATDDDGELTLDDLKTQLAKAKADAKKSWDDAHMTPAQRAEKAQAERDKKIVAAKERTTAANKRYDVAKKN